MHVPTPPFLITFRPDLHILIIRWLREISQLELQQGYQELLKEALRHNATHWLVDSRRRAQSDGEMVEWLSTAYLPSLPSSLGADVFLACLTAATWQQNGPHNTPLAVLAQRTKSLDQQGFQVQLFGDEGTAVAWLQGKP